MWGSPPKTFWGTGNPSIPPWLSKVLVSPRSLKRFLPVFAWKPKCQFLISRRLYKAFWGPGRLPAVSPLLRTARGQLQVAWTVTSRWHGKGYHLPTSPDGVASLIDVPWVGQWLETQLSIRVEITKKAGDCLWHHCLLWQELTIPLGRLPFLLLIAPPPCLLCPGLSTRKPAEPIPYQLHQVHQGLNFSSPPPKSTRQEYLLELLRPLITNNVKYHKYKLLLQHFPLSCSFDSIPVL